MPVGPEFQDPRPELVPEQPPYLVSVEPPLQKTVNMDSVNSMSFVVNMGDPNPTDSLSVRWVANYPLYLAEATKLLREEILRRPDSGIFELSRSVTCKGDFMGMAADRNLTVIVSDRPFIDETLAPDPQNRYSYEDRDGPTLIPFVIGWRIAGCPTTTPP